jgi:subtilisin-like proprotein convertase family protein
MSVYRCLWGKNRAHSLARSPFFSRLLGAAALTLALLSSAALAAEGDRSADRAWTIISPSDLTARRASGARPWIQPDKFAAVELEPATLQATLKNAPMEFTNAARDARRRLVIELPAPEGDFERFEVVESPIAEQGLLDWMADQGYPMATYKIRGLDDTTATGRIDMGGPAGFHAMVQAMGGSWFVDPYWQGDTRLYTSYLKADFDPRNNTFLCNVDDTAGALSAGLPLDSGARAGGNNLSTYRLANAGNFEYTTFHGGTQVAGQAAIVTIVNRVNQIYERDLGVRLVLVANNMNLVFTSNPETPADYTNAGGATDLARNQTNCDGIIGNANYDIGHVFGTGLGGIAGLGVVCNSSNKGRGLTGLNNPVGDPFAIDFVAHEYGHQFGGRHTYDSNEPGNCGPQHSGTVSDVEPGSGSTIMSYAGVCPPHNLQSNSDAMFHAFSIFNEMNPFILGTATCRVDTATGNNNAPTVQAPAGGPFFIPISTSFELTAINGSTGGDATDGTLTYSWEQMDGNGTSAAPGTDTGTNALFRAFLPTTSPTRSFPNPATGASIGETLPTTNRTMNFRVVVRDNNSEVGRVGSADVQLTSLTTAGPFALTAPNGGEVFAPGSSPTVTWNVAGTTSAPISAANVSIELSTDGGLTYPTVLLASTPNDGSQSVTLPGSTSSTARIRVKAVGNVFFDASDANFNITNDTIMTYDNTTPGTIPSPGCAPTRTFNVPDSLTISDVNLGVNCTHPFRGVVRVRLTSPASTVVTLTAFNGSDFDNNIDVLFDSASSNPFDDGNDDDTAAPLYDRTVGTTQSLNAFNGQNSAGTWTLELCDISTGAGPGTFNSARLIITQAGVDATPPAVQSINRVSASPTNAASVSWTVTFSESVTGVDTGDFALANTGLTGPSITGVSGSGTTYTVTANTGTGSGMLGLNLVDNNSIIDGASNPLGPGDGSFTGQVYTIDKTGPTTSAPDMTTGTDSGSSNSDNITNDNTPTFTGTASEGGVSVTLFRGGSTSLGTITADGAGAWSITASAIPDGNHSITAQATDTLGNVGAMSSGLAITIDTTAPAAPTTPDMTAGTDSGSSNSDNITNDNTPTFTGTAEANSTVTLSSSVSGNAGTASADAAGNWSLTASALAQGGHNMTATATDAAGNVSPSSGALAITIDTMAPIANITPVMPDPTTNPAGTVTITFSESVTGVNIADFSLTLDSNPVNISGLTVNGSGASYTVDLTSVTSANGAYVFTLVASGSGISDTAGNNFAANASDSWTKLSGDTTPPAVVSINGAVANPTSSASITWIVTFSESVTGVNIGDFVLAPSGVTGAAILGVTITGPTTANVSVSTGTGDGTLGLNLVDDDSIIDGASNPLGGAGAGNGNFTGQVYTIDKTPPTVQSITRDDANPTNAAQVHWTVTFSESVSPVIGGDFSLVIPGLTGATIFTVTGSGATRTVTGNTGTGSGSFRIDILDDDSILDTAGNPLGGVGAGNGSFNGGETYTIDKTPPATPSAPDMTALSDSGSSNSDNITSDTTPDFTGTAEAGATVTLISSVNGNVGTATADGAGNWSITASTLSEGAHNMTATAADSLGNTSAPSTALGITIDTTAPASPSAPDLAPASDLGASNTDDITSDTTPTFNGTAEANSAVELLEGATPLGSSTADGAGNWSITSSALADGLHIIVAEATDAAGNASVVSNTLSVTIDTTVPTLSITSGETDPTSNTPFSVSFAFSESVTGFALGDIVVGNGSASNLAGAGANYTADITPAGAGLVTVDVAGGVATDTAGNGNSVAPQFSITFTPAAASPLIINELDSDTPGADALEFVEIYNTSASPVNLAGHVLVFYNGANNLSYFAIDLAGTIPANGFHVLGNAAVANVTQVFAGNLLQNGADAAALYQDSAASFPNGTAITATNLVDALVYDTSDTDDPELITGLGVDIQVDENLNTLGTTQSIQRVPDGQGGPLVWSGNFQVIAPTPGTTNGVSDTTPPTVSSIVRVDANPTNAASVSWTVTFSESVAGVDLTDFSLASTGVTGESITGVSGSGMTYTVTANTGTGDGALGLDLLDDDSIVDGASNPLGGAGAGNGDFVGEVYTIDKTGPTTTTPDLTAGADTGSSNTDDNTSDNTPDFTGTTEANATVQLFSDGSPVGATIADGAGVWTITASTLADGVRNMTAQATDALDNVGPLSAGLSVTIDTAAPMADIVDVTPDPRTTDAGTVMITFSESVTGVDIADFSLTLDSNPVGIGGLTVNGSGASYTVDLSSVTGTDGAYVFTLNAPGGIADTAGNALAANASDDWIKIAGGDTTPPTAVCMDITVQLNALGSVTITGADIDGGSTDNVAIATLMASPSSFTCSDAGNVVMATLTVTDTSNNMSTCTAMVTVEDNVDPVALCQDITVQLDSTGNASITAAMVNNGSSDACGIASLMVSPAAFTCANVGANTVTLTVTDVNGNVSTCNSTVTVEDNVDPTITCPADQMVSGDMSGNASMPDFTGLATAMDACGVASVTQSPTAATTVSGTFSTTLTVTDNNGNTANCSFMVTVTVAPPSGIMIVDTLVDESDGDFSALDFSLREAIEQSAPGDTIEFAVSGTISLTLGTLPAINHALTIDGDGNITLANAFPRAAVNNRAMFINTGSTVNLIGMSFDSFRAQGGDGGDGDGPGGGAAGMGGAILVNSGNVVLNNCDFTGNVAQGGAGGNGANVFHGGGGGGLGADGADAIASGPTAGGSGHISLDPALNGVGGVPGAPNGGNGGDGAGGGGGQGIAGGIGGDGGFGGGGGGGGGGALAASGIGGDGGFGGGGGSGGRGGSGSSAGGFGGLFAGNGASGGGGGGGAGMGGAVFVRSGSLNVINSTFANNSALGGAGGLNNLGAPSGQPGQGHGGAIFINLGATLTGSGNAFTGNSAPDNTGALNADDNNIFYGGAPLAVELESFEAIARTKFAPVRVKWTTSAEIDVLGFDVHRAERDASSRSEWSMSGEPLNAMLIPGRGTPSRGADYQFIDTLWTMGQERAYFLIDIDLSGRETIHGPAFVEYVDPAQVQGEVETLPEDEAEAATGKNPLTGDSAKR